MNIIWKQATVNSLLKLDIWRKENEWPPISSFLVEKIEVYFMSQNLSLYVPGRKVMIRGLPVNLRMVLITVGKSDPYKVFFRLSGINIEIYLIRHPHQKSLF
jgi:hypothetical protein